MNGSETPKHHNLKMELAELLESWGHNAEAIDGYTKKSPRKVENTNKVGDGEDKIPDIDGFNPGERQYLRGEAKIGDGDIESLHSITQYMLFSDLYNKENRKNSLLFIIVPASCKNELNDVLIRHVPRRNWENIRMIQSSRYSD